MSDPSPRVAYLTHPRFVEHDHPGHAENAHRIRACWRELAEGGLLPRMVAITPEPAQDGDLLRTHEESYLQQLDLLAQQDPTRRFLLDADTYASAVSPTIARLAAGAAIGAVEALQHDRAQRALVLARPPGHHARPMTAMGFCLLGNVAIAALHAVAEWGLERVLVVDYDVHHGNGTQEMLYENANALFFSVHQSPFYPGTGLLHEIGAGRGRGTTINAPLPPGHGDDSYRRLMDTVLLPAARRFEPQLVLVSAGFDAHWQDPLARMNLSLRGYDEMARSLIHLADECCQGRIIFFLEGGYDTRVLASGVRNLAHALLGDEECHDPFGPPPQASPAIDSLLRSLCQIHELPAS
ncbi:MAG: histone deacetylase [Anaerolineaceae bacterium]|nr:histone deacetylase [Anaerolineaceae bacterium]MCY4008986.1 histone deacetylase [Anaerolineaceae bacterium]MCY4105792.1 histone deacetylase [Chloroflexota bacterium]